MGCFVHGQATKESQLDNLAHTSIERRQPAERIAERNDVVLLRVWQLLHVIETHVNRREKPPASRYFIGSVDATDAFIPTTDADGHFAGGIRLPHVTSTVHGRVAGAPLGRYAPLNPAGLDPLHPFVFLGGTFSAFTDDELLSRYASRQQYVRRVTRAVNHLAARGYISNKDRVALIAAAQHF